MFIQIISHYHTPRTFHQHYFITMTSNVYKLGEINLRTVKRVMYLGKYSEVADIIDCNGYIVRSIAENKPRLLIECKFARVQVNKSRERTSASKTNGYIQGERTS